MNWKGIVPNSLLILLLSLGLMIGGCSQMNSNDDNSGNSSVLAPTDLLNQPSDGSKGELSRGPDGPQPFDLTRYHYPPGADQPPPGRLLVQLGANNTDYTPGGDWVFTYVYRGVGAELWYEGSGIVIQPNGAPYSTWIAMTEPNPEGPWVEFEPHGLYFTKGQYARISYKDCPMPDGVSAEDLEVWYWNDELGKYELIGGNNNLTEQYIEFDIEHFSRYVVAGEE